MTTTMPPRGCVLALNAGSSSLRFAIYHASEPLRLLLRGKLQRIGAAGTHWQVEDAAGEVTEDIDIEARDHGAATDYLIRWLEAQGAFAAIAVVAHRVVHGMKRTLPERVTPQLLADLRGMMAFDPEHLPFEIALLEAIARRQPALPQIACFDTVFHRYMPQVARRLPLPRRYQALGIERYGFHGLSCSYLMHELVRLEDAAATGGRVILAHLGNGASLTAVLHGRGIDTTMGFTPTGGIMMGTRAGDLDPALSFYFAQTQDMSAATFQHMVNHESGLLGISETSADVQALLAAEADDDRAADALAMFCYQAKKWIGALSTALGGLDTLVFAGGIGENAPVIRRRICTGLEFLGIELEGACNAKSAGVISTADSRVTVRVVRTDEEQMLARLALPFCNAPEKSS
jgi:acetate kinase